MYRPCGPWHERPQLAPSLSLPSMPTWQPPATRFFCPAAGPARPNSGGPWRSLLGAKQRSGALRVCRYMPSDLWGYPPTAAAAASVPAGRAGPAAAQAAVTALYEAHALGLIRLAHVMLGQRQGAEDVVQEAFCGLYRRWPRLSDRPAPCLTCG
ncbi:MAG: hypothetical protein J2P34_06265, partial [Actinobacteria bacterium]|nr:hypothetical protein [Actinomycetota bacterium]